MKTVHKNAIALLITLFFLMAITISIGIGFKYVNEAKASIKDENFLLQSNIILDDIFSLLRKELKKVEKNDEVFDIFLDQSEFIPLEIEGIKVLISIKSARSKINLNSLINTPLEDKKIIRFKEFLTSYNVNLNYVDMLRDVIKQNDPAITGIIDEKPDMFREYISSNKQLKEINEFYTNNYYDNSLSKIEFKELFYYGRDNNATCIDYIHMTPWSRHMVEGLSLEDAEEFSGVDSNETHINGFKLCSSENRRYLDVNLDISQGKNKAKIAFEYDIDGEKGYNFSYEI